MMARTADNGRYRRRQYMHAMSCFERPGKNESDSRRETYGRQHEAPRHRRNRPCTYPTCGETNHQHQCSHASTSDLILIPIPIPLRQLSGTGRKRDGGWYCRVDDRPVGGGVFGNEGRGGAKKKYPLSITRAATSSARTVKKNQVSYDSPVKRRPKMVDGWMDGWMGFGGS